MKSSLSSSRRARTRLQPPGRRRDVVERAPRPPRVRRRPSLRVSAEHGRDGSVRDTALLPRCDRRGGRDRPPGLRRPADEGVGHLPGLVGAHPAHRLRHASRVGGVGSGDGPVEAEEAPARDHGGARRRVRGDAAGRRGGRDPPARRGGAHRDPAVGRAGVREHRRPRRRARSGEPDALRGARADARPDGGRRLRPHSPLAGIARFRDRAGRPPPLLPAAPGGSGRGCRRGAGPGSAPLALVLPREAARHGLDRGLRARRRARARARERFRPPRQADDAVGRALLRGSRVRRAHCRRVPSSCRRSRPSTGRAER